MIIITGSAGPIEYAAAEKVGAQAVYSKPTRLEDLQQLIAKIADEFCCKPHSVTAPLESVVVAQNSPLPAFSPIPSLEHNALAHPL